MPLHVQYTAPEEAVEPGIYMVRVDAIGELPNSRYEGTLRWTFTIVDNRVPQYYNKTIYGMTSSKPSPRSKLFAWLRAFGITMDLGQTFDLELLIGKQVIANVENSTSMTNGHEVTYSNVKDLMNAAQMPQPVQHPPMQATGGYAPAPQQPVYQQQGPAPVQQYQQPPVQQQPVQQPPVQQFAPQQPAAGQQVVYQPAPQAAMQRPQTAAPQQPMQPMPQPVVQQQAPQQQPLVQPGQLKPAEDVYNF